MSQPIFAPYDSNDMSMTFGDTSSLWNMEEYISPTALPVTLPVRSSKSSSAELRQQINTMENTISIMKTTIESLQVSLDGIATNQETISAQNNSGLVDIRTNQIMNVGRVTDIRKTVESISTILMRQIDAVETQEQRVILAVVEIIRSEMGEMKGEMAQAAAGAVSKAIKSKVDSDYQTVSQPRPVAQMTPSPFRSERSQQQKRQKSAE